MNTARDIQNSTTDTLNNIQFSDIFDLNEIQRLQDLFSDATGVASIITYPDGTPITKPSNFCRLCGIIRKTEKGRANCYKSDAVIGKQNSSGPIVQPCLSGGLWDAGTSITVGGKHIANWLIGQVRNEELDEQRMIQYADEIGANREDFLEALIEVPVMSLERFKKVSEMLFAFASELSEKAYNNLQLKMQIAEREKATELLKENEERYRTLFEQSNDAIFLVDTATGNYLDANRAAEIMTGRSQNEFKGLNTHDITPKGAEKRLEKLLDANDPLEMGEVEYLRPDGTTRTAVLNTIPLRKGRAFGIAHDITKRKRVQEALLESEERFRNFVETSADLIFSLSKIGFIEYVSPRVTDLYGYEPASLIGKHLKTTTPIKEVPKAIKALKFVLSGNSLKNFQINQISKTGKIIPIEINAVPVWKAGKIIGCQGIMRDITERKHAEEALRGSEKLYRSLFNNMLNGFAYCRMLYDRGQPSDFIYLGVNGAFEVQTGLRNVAGKKVSEVIPGIRESDPKLFEIYGRVASTGKPEVFEMYIAALQMWFSISVYSPAKNHFVAVFDVITERKLAEEALRISQKKYKDIIDYSPVGFYQSNMDGDIILANDRFSKILGYESAAGILNRNFVKDIFYDPSERSVLINQITGIGGSRDYELRWKKRDGVPIWVMNSIRVVKDESGNILYFEGFVQDIDLRKKHEAELVKLSTAVEQSPVSILITDTNGNIEYSNPKVTEITGYQLAELVGKNPRVLKSGEIPASEYQVLWDTILSGREWQGEFHNKKKNGELYWEYATISPIFNEKGAITHFLAVKEDITQRKEMINELIKAKEKAEESDRLKSAFLTNISHEIRTPMNGILGFAQILKEPDLTGEQQQEYISTIEKCGVRMLNTINDIVDISKIESGQIIVFVTETNVNEKMNDIYTFFKPEAEQKRLQINYKNALPAKETIIKTDRNKLFTILSNLVNNAIKFTKTGSIEIGCNIVETLDATSLLEFYVRDTGIGIRPDQKEFIFERFRQASESLSRKYEGAGLGLAIAKSYVEMLGGKIWVESEEGKGSTFYFTIPYLV